MTSEMLTQTTEQTQAQPRPKRTFPCWCGCGGRTQSRFVPGHDAKLASRARSIARGEANLDEELARLPHDEAREELGLLVAKARKIEAEKAAKRAAERAAKLAATQEPAEQPDEEPVEQES